MQKVPRLKKLSKFDPYWSYILFIIWPFIGMIFSAATFSYRSSRVTLVLFSVLFGLTLVVYSRGIDAYTYGESFQEVATLPFSDVFQIFRFSHVNETGELDFFLPVLFFIVSRFTNDPQILFGVFALILSTVLVANLRLLYQSYSLSKNRNSILFIFFFISIVPITNINHFRWYTALLLFMLACQYIIAKGKRSYLILAFLAPMVHFSFGIPVGLLIVYLLLGNRFLVYYILLVSSFLFADLALPYIKNFIDGFSEGVQERVGSYTTENYIDDIKLKTEQRVWILLYSTTIAKYYFFGALLYLKHFTKLFDKRTNSLYAFSLVILSFANFGKDIESLGSRFSVAYLVLGCIIMVNTFIRSKNKSLSFVSLIGIIPYLLITIMNVRMSIELVNINVLFPLIPTPFYFNKNISLFQVFQ